MAANILLVEDEPAIQELIAVNLEHAGHHVIRARDAEGALGIVRNALPDLLLIDWMLPGMSGVSLARQLRQEERTREIPIILLTARSADDRRPDRGERPAARPRDAARVRQLATARAGSDRVQAAALPDDAPRAGALAHAAPRSGMGGPRVRRGAHGGRAHPAAAQGARALRP